MEKFMRRRTSLQLAACQPIAALIDEILITNEDGESGLDYALLQRIRHRAEPAGTGKQQAVGVSNDQPTSASGIQQHCLLA